MSETTETTAPTKQRKVRQGRVVSDKMQQTIVVQVKRRIRHPLYKMVVTRAKKFYAHDPEGTAKVGDVVNIRETRPLSKLKRWELVEVVDPAQAVSAR